MSILITLLTLTGILAIGFAIVLVVAGFFFWTRYRLAMDAAQHVNALITANRATPRPGMARPDPRFTIVARHGRREGEDYADVG